MKTHEKLCGKSSIHFGCSETFSVSRSICEMMQSTLLTTVWWSSLGLKLERLPIWRERDKESYDLSGTCFLNFTVRLSGCILQKYSSTAYIRVARNFMHFRFGFSFHTGKKYKGCNANTSQRTSVCRWLFHNDIKLWAI